MLFVSIKQEFKGPFNAEIIARERGEMFSMSKYVGEGGETICFS